jgi:hypothetical protein
MAVPLFPHCPGCFHLPVSECSCWLSPCRFSPRLKLLLPQYPNHYLLFFLPSSPASAVIPSASSALSYPCIIFGSPAALSYASVRLYPSFFFYSLLPLLFPFCCFTLLSCSLHSPLAIVLCIFFLQLWPCAALPPPVCVATSTVIHVHSLTHFQVYPLDLRHSISQHSSLPYSISPCGCPAHLAPPYLPHWSILHRP